MTAEEPKRLVLHEAHERLGARFAPFAGYLMPLRYSGIVDEHNAVREHVGVFDVSHMGNFFLTGDDAVSAIDRIVTNDIASLPVGGAAYTVMCTDTAGIVDDLIVYKQAPNRIFAVVNAARREADLEHMRRHIDADADALLVDETDDFVLLAVQGPEAEATLDPIVDVDLTELEPFNGVAAHFADGATEIFIGRTGYTGEDGFEVLIPNAEAERAFEWILESGEAHEIQPAGLGARDTLRLEARYPLYGNDIGLDTNPYEAGLGWVVKLRKDTPFVGQEALRTLRKNRAVTRRLRGVSMDVRGVLRPGYKLYLLGHAIGIAYVGREHADIEEGVEVEIRGRRFPVKLHKRPFYKR